MKKVQKNKYNYLEKKGTYLTKQDYIETDYVNGVYDENGNELIRPLSQEEKAFLAKYYKETVHAKPVTNKKSKDLVVKIKKLRKKHKKYSLEKGDDHPDVKKELAMLKKEKEKLGNLYTDFDKTSKLYAENYSRNNCIQNKFNKYNSSMDNIEDHKESLTSEDVERAYIVLTNESKKK